MLDKVNQLNFSFKLLQLNCLLNIANNSTINNLLIFSSSSYNGWNRDAYSLRIWGLG